MRFYMIWNSIRLTLKSIGRSEDMVDIQQAKVIDLVETGNISVTSEYSAYIDF